MLCHIPRARLAYLIGQCLTSPCGQPLSLVSFIRSVNARYCRLLRCCLCIWGVTISVYTSNCVVAIRLQCRWLVFSSAHWRHVGPLANFGSCVLIGLIPLCSALALFWLPGTSPHTAHHHRWGCWPCIVSSTGAACLRLWGAWCTLSSVTKSTFPSPIPSLCSELIAVLPL